MNDEREAFEDMSDAMLLLWVETCESGTRTDTVPYYPSSPYLALSAPHRVPPCCMYCTITAINTNDGAVDAGIIHATGLAAVRSLPAQILQGGLRPHGGGARRPARLLHEQEPATYAGILAPEHGDVHEMALVPELRPVLRRRARPGELWAPGWAGVGMTSRRQREVEGGR